MAKRRRQPARRLRPAGARRPGQSAPRAQPAPRRPAHARDRHFRATGGRSHAACWVAPTHRASASSARCLLAVVVVVLAVVAGGSGAGPYTCGQELATWRHPEDGQVTANIGRGHVTPGIALSYLFCPPALGQPLQQRPASRPPGPGSTGRTRPSGPGSWVHNLEHGYVVALYRCPDGACPSEDVLPRSGEFVNNGPQTAVAANCGIRSKIARRPLRRHGDAVRPADVGPRLAARSVRRRRRHRLRRALDGEDRAPEATSC